MLGKEEDSWHSKARGLGPTASPCTAEPSPHKEACLAGLPDSSSPSSSPTRGRHLATKSLSFRSTHTRASNASCRHSVLVLAFNHEAFKEGNLVLKSTSTCGVTSDSTCVVVKFQGEDSSDPSGCFSHHWLSSCTTYASDAALHWVQSHSCRNAARVVGCGVLVSGAECVLAPAVGVSSPPGSSLLSCNTFPSSFDSSSFDSRAAATGTAWPSSSDNAAACF
mmetsp:Transcript_5112/g.9737  ORF Transcript_5112/g.9737 Transcript_5112/m.9737 type:complete len:222 (-) Transcript_5112:487-1152(-)